MTNDMANMEPIKELFVLAITKDIKLDSAICELVDNSIHAAEKLNKFKSIKGYRVDLYIGKSKNNDNEFLIKDNCGGIAREDARNKAFKLGNDFKVNKSGFGIGMKRALFKLAEEFVLESYTIDDNFKIEMNILSWEKKKGWNIPIKNNKKNLKLKSGVIISIPKLNEDIKKELLSQDFKRKLENKIKSNYEFTLEAGFEIYINGKKILYNDKVNSNNLLQSGKYMINGNSIQLRIENGCKRSQEFYGWNYVINGKIIVQGDKSNLSNWEETMKNPEYNYDKFVGFIFIDGDNVSELPVNTSKDGIDINSKIYKVIQKYMKVAINKTKENFRDIERSIEYKKPISEIDDLKKILGKRSNADVGRESFDICLKKLK